MSIRATYSIAAVAGGTMLAFSLSPASAFTLSGPSLEQPVASAQVDKAWYRYGYGWRGGYYRPGWGYGYGYRPGWGYGHCWRGYYGALHCN